MGSALGLAVSNIAWMPEQDDDVARVLVDEGVAGVEIAPTKWRERPLNASARDIASYRQSWEARGLRIASLQSLLFGRPDFQLFGDDTNRASMIDYLRRVIDLASGLGARSLVFGSPKNRMRGSMNDRETTAIAVDAFRELGEHASARSVLFCLEANPPEYGCDWVTTTAEAIAVCRAVDHPGFRVNVDLGGITISQDDASRSVAEAGELIGHVHASEPNLAELGAGADHAGAGAALAELGYDGWVSIEMRSVSPTASVENVDAVRRAVQLAKAKYAPVLP